AAARTMRARSARRLSVFPARTQLSSVERSSGVKVRAVGYLLIPNHDIDRFSLQLSTRNIEVEKPRMDPYAIADMVLSFFSGVCIERNLESGKGASTRKTATFMKVLR